MRIAIIVPGGVDRSGEYRVIPALLAYIKRLSVDNDVEVIALRQEDEPQQWPLAGARIHNIGSRYTRTRALGALYRLHRERRFDIVHAFWSGPCGLIAVIASKWLHIPALIHVAGGELASLPEISYGGVQRWRGRIREVFTLRAATRVTAASEAIIESIGALGIRAYRVPLGVDLNLWPVRPPLSRDTSRAARLIHVASLNRVKDQTTLLMALATLKESAVQFQMEFVGEDTLNGEIQRKTLELGLADQVTFRGFLTQRALRPVMEAADLHVISSRHEAGPLVAFEAAIAGVPSVGTAVGHISEWAPAAALSVPVGDWSALAAAITRLLADETLRLSVAREAQRLAMAQDADYTASCFLTLYAELAGPRGQTRSSSST